MGLTLLMPGTAFADDPVPVVPPVTDVVGTPPPPPDGTGPGAATEGVSATYYDDYGNVIATTPETVEPADDTGVISSDTADPGDSIQGLPDDSPATDPLYMTTDTAMQGMVSCSSGKVCGSPTSHGCVTWDVWHAHYDDAGHLMFKFHLDVHFCWKKKHICTCPDPLRVETRLSDTDPVIDDQGNIKDDSSEYYYQYWNGISDSGHASKETRHINYCMWDVCYDHIYPWIHEYVHGDGTMYYHTGE